ncbi:MAG: hypothetical protein HDS64_06950 [Bacteroidales bacterium]|nr:hypothetical protein [Bacteroidales bacterium]
MEDNAVSVAPPATLTLTALSVILERTKHRVAYGLCRMLAGFALPTIAYQSLRILNVLSIIFFSV